MSSERLTRLSITVFVAVMLGLVAVLYFNWDADRTDYCIEQGGTEASCGWR
jgi:hypothetical protein